MKVGDLVRMKGECYASMRPGHPQATTRIGLVFAVAGRGLKVYMPNGAIKVGLTNQWEIINER